ncbi:hypothetical protein QJQ45_029934, partial [Haematococcus lacustris]
MFIRVASRVGLHFIKLDSRVLHGVCTQLGLTKETKEAFTTEPALRKHWARWFSTGKLANKGFEFERTVETDGLEEDMVEVSMERHGRAKQLVVFFGAAGIGTRGGWGADAVLRACRKVVCRPRGKDQDGGRVVLVDEHRTSRVSSAVNGKQPCEEELDHEQPTRPADWKPPEGQGEHRLLCPASSQQRDQQPGSHTASRLGARPITPLLAKRSKRNKAEQAAKSTQPTEGKGKAKGKAAQTKPTPQSGRWLDRDCNAALNIQHIEESRWRPLELCWWPEQFIKGGYVPPNSPPPAQGPPPLPQPRTPMPMSPPTQDQPRPTAPGPVPPPQPPPWGRWLDRDTNSCLNFQCVGESMQRSMELCSWKDREALPQWFRGEMPP